MSRLQIVVVRGNHHLLRGRQIKDLDVPQILLGHWLVGPCDLRAQDGIPRDPGALGHIEDQRDMSVGVWRDDMK